MRKVNAMLNPIDPTDKEKTLIKLLVKSCVIIFCTLFAVASTAAAESDYSARPSLSANGHFAAAKAINDMTLEYEDGAEFPTDAAMQAVFHLEQAIAKGYTDRKQARLLLQRMLGVWAMSNYDCVAGKHKNSKDPVIQEICSPFVAANKRGINMIPELYRDYPDDPQIVHFYYGYISGTGASQTEKEAILKNALNLVKDPGLMAELAYVLVGEQKFEEAKARLAEALELISDEYLLAEQIDRYFRDFRGFGCAMPAETEQAVIAIPERYKSDSEMHKHEQKVKEKIKPTKEELEDSNKLAAIKKQVIDAIRKAQCKS